MRQEKEKSGGGFFWKLLLLIAVGIFCFSAYQLFTIYQGYKTGVDEYQAIEEQVISVKKPGKPGKHEEPEKSIEDMTEEEIEEVQEEMQEELESLKPIEQKETEEGEVVSPDSPITYPPVVDFAQLQAINPDVVGWIQMEAVPTINYPLLKGRDNDHYLHTTVMGTENFAGSVFLDASNSGDFTDPNTIIYGHNMKNGSMFGKLKWLLERGKYKNSRYFWIATPQGTYLYEIFSMQYVNAVSDTYTLFPEHDENFQNYVINMANRSRVNMGAQDLGMYDRVITLSTCTSNDDIRFVVQGRWIATY